MKTFLGNLLGIAVYAVLFLILILLMDLDKSVRFDIGLSLILALFFGILNEIHRELTEKKKWPNINTWNNRDIQRKVFVYALIVKKCWKTMIMTKALNITILLLDIVKSVDIQIIGDISLKMFT